MKINSSEMKILWLYGMQDFIYNAMLIKASQKLLNKGASNLSGQNNFLEGFFCKEIT